MTLEKQIRIWLCNTGNEIDKDELVSVLLQLVERTEDANRYRKLIDLATKWPQTELVVNINIGHDWTTATTKDEINSVIDSAILAQED